MKERLGSYAQASLEEHNYVNVPLSNVFRSSRTKGYEKSLYHRRVNSRTELIYLVLAGAGGDHDSPRRNGALKQEYDLKLSFWIGPPDERYVDHELELSGFAKSQGRRPACV